MDPIALLTTFGGRINRARFWFGVLCVLILSLILQALFLGLFVSFFSFDLQGGAAMAGSEAARALGFFLMALPAWPFTALFVKRLRDRDRPLWLVVVFWLPTVASVLAYFTGVGLEEVQVSGYVFYKPNALGVALNIVGFIVGLWVLVELGFLKGTTGPNRHGPDPLAVGA